MNLMLLGAISLACFMVSLFFFRFWRKTHDRFFMFFSLSFFIEGFGRMMMGLNYSDEEDPVIYFIRFISFSVILYAIVDKNWIKNVKK